ncbi:unnamed protein product [Cylindrotheca closterium]|uniref:Uncharacterized protein n=1 Tax=Cylindrotheca closterium TaxID=2856 RepID=A0AAD2JMY7_9STRA|nr:unnamed protein product [Cylindrotheca closterium]
MAKLQIEIRVGEAGPIYSSPFHFGILPSRQIPIYKYRSMYSTLHVRPAGKLGPKEYSKQRELILNKIAQMRSLQKTAPTDYGKEGYQKEIQLQVEALKRLNEQQNVEMNDLELEEVERGFEVVEMTEQAGSSS